jgi:hypothetical protein
VVGLSCWGTPQRPRGGIGVRAPGSGRIRTDLDRADGQAGGEQGEGFVEFLVEAEGSDHGDLAGDDGVAWEACVAGWEEAEEDDCATAVEPG